MSVRLKHLREVRRLIFFQATVKKKIGVSSSYFVDCKQQSDRGYSNLQLVGRTTPRCVANLVGGGQLGQWALGDTK